MSIHLNPTLFFPMTPELRARIEELVEDLVSILDASDIDPDFEPSEDFEPTLGAAESHPSSREWLGTRPRHPRSGELHRDGEGCQVCWGLSNADDGEREIENEHGSDFLYP